MTAESSFDAITLAGGGANSLKYDVVVDLREAGVGTIGPN